MLPYPLLVMCRKCKEMSHFGNRTCRKSQFWSSELITVVSTSCMCYSIVICTPICMLPGDFQRVRGINMHVFKGRRSKHLTVFHGHPLMLSHECSVCRHAGGGTTFILEGPSINIANFDHTHQAYSSIMDRNIGGGEGVQPQSPMGSAAYGT